MTAEAKTMDNTFVAHFAIPTHDLDAALEFYRDVIGCEPARRYDDRQTFKFFTHQIVCHLAPDEIADAPTFYPRHYGITFRKWEPFEELHERIVASGHDFFVPMSKRFWDWPEKHKFFAVTDYSNNVIEFKCYDQEQYIY